MEPARELPLAAHTEHRTTVIPYASCTKNNKSATDGMTGHHVPSIQQWSGAQLRILIAGKQLGNKRALVLATH